MLSQQHYFDLLDEQEPRPVPCPVCTGAEDAEPCGEDCDRIVRKSRARSKVRGLYVDAWRALRFARTYYGLCGGGDYRVRQAVRRVYLIRCQIEGLRRAA